MLYHYISYISSRNYIRCTGIVMSTRDRRDEKRSGSASWQGDDDGEMDRDDNRARGDRSLSEPGGSSFGHVLFSDAPRVCAAKAVGTGVKFRHRIGGTAATDDRPHDPTVEAALVGGPSGVRRRRAAGTARPRYSEDASSRARTAEPT